MPKKLLSRKEAATYSGMSTYMIDQLRKSGKIREVPSGGRVYIHKEKLDEWLDDEADAFKRGRASGADN